MRACSFLPASTQMIYELGLEDRLVGVTFECHSDRPKIVRSHLEGRSLTSAEIDTIVSEYERDGKTLYYIDDALLREAAPDVVFTQHVCDVCQIGTAYVERAVHSLPHVPKLVPLVPRRFHDVVENLRTIARELGAAEAAEDYVSRTLARVDAIVDALRVARALPRRVMVMEWLDPIYNCGHWIPDQIALAGGADAISAPGGYSVPIDWEIVRKHDSEVLVVAPCGFDVARTSKELARLTERAGFGELTAVRNRRAFAVDADLFTQPSLPRLVDGIELLAHLFHPTVVPAPSFFAERCAAIV